MEDDFCFLLLPYRLGSMHFLFAHFVRMPGGLAFCLICLYLRVPVYLVAHFSLRVERVVGNRLKTLGSCRCSDSC